MNSKCIVEHREIHIGTNTTYVLSPKIVIYLIIYKYWGFKVGKKNRCKNISLKISNIFSCLPCSNAGAAGHISHLNKVNNFVQPFVLPLPWGAFTYDFRCFGGIFDLPTYLPTLIRYFTT